MNVRWKKFTECKMMRRGSWNCAFFWLGQRLLFCSNEKAGSEEPAIHVIINYD